MTRLLLVTVKCFKSRPISKPTCMSMAQIDTSGASYAVESRMSYGRFSSLVSVSCLATESAELEALVNEIGSMN